MTSVTADEIRGRERLTRDVRDAALSMLRSDPRLQHHPAVSFTTTDEPCAIVASVKVLRPVLLTTRTVYVHGIAWSRGWSVFASYAPIQGAYDWRHQPHILAGLQHPVYAPRDKPGAWYVSPDDLATHIGRIVELLLKQDTAAQNRVRRKYWYWSTEVLARAYCHGSE